PASYAAIREAFAYWDDIETFQGGEWVRSTGHGFCGMSRKRLLEILVGRCLEVGVELSFEDEVTDVAELEGADLVLAADGINSLLREHHAAHFQPSLDWRHCRFTWLGTTKPLETFTFVFLENEHGLFQVHAYPFEVGEEPLSTWIVECSTETWQRAGLDQASEDDTVAYCQELFAEFLDGHPLLTNRSIWRQFPTVRCERWVHDNMVLLGDAAHTAHFSIGSGTKLAMEDAIALAEAFREHGPDDVPRALRAYEDGRKVDVLKLQKAAQTSLEWFEHSARYLNQHPLQFSFNLLTRSKRITYDNLALRDPELVERVRRWWLTEEGADPNVTTAPIFAPLTLRDTTLPNRIVVSPMCQYSAEDGVVGDWHLMHLGSLAVGGAGLVVAEMTNVSAEGRITYGCTGIYDEVQVEAWRRVTDFCHAHGAAALGLQLGHAGRKASCHLPWEGDDPLRDDTAWTAIGPSADAFAEGWPTPHPMDRGDMDRVIAEYEAATQGALAADFDLVEVHMAHGYLLSSFLSPAANRRRDEYGGDLSARMRFPLEVVEAVRAAWPAERPLFVRVSATDWLPEGGTTIEETLELVRALQARGVDVIDVSTGGNTPESAPIHGRMYQVPFAEHIRHATGVKVMAVGAIQGWDHANTVLAAGRADLCALARPHLIDPHLTLRAGIAFEDPTVAWPRQYLPARPKPKA
ncbi:MAG: FAD-dependent monooxygenase, partial [Planctomycetota bacterium]|nr:FAD-dependent monooxygenase [Planctomycetota bacterium]